MVFGSVPKEGLLICQFLVQKLQNKRTTKQVLLQLAEGSVDSLGVPFPLKFLDPPLIGLTCLFWSMSIKSMGWFAIDYGIHCGKSIAQAS